MNTAATKVKVKTLNIHYYVFNENKKCVIIVPQLGLQYKDISEEKTLGHIKKFSTHLINAWKIKNELRGMIKERVLSVNAKKEKVQNFFDKINLSERALPTGYQTKDFILKVRM